MSKLHDPKNPRHARLFELLRQQTRSQTTVTRGKGFIVRKLSKAQAAQIKAAADRSLLP